MEEKEKEKVEVEVVEDVCLCIGCGEFYPPDKIFFGRYCSNCLPK